MQKRSAFWRSAEILRIYCLQEDTDYKLRNELPTRFYMFALDIHLYLLHPAEQCVRFSASDGSPELRRKPAGVEVSPTGIQFF
jgi:hypothetical protein